MNNKASIYVDVRLAQKYDYYIDIRLAQKYNYACKARIYLNGREIKRVVSAKSGKNGFVEYAEESGFKNYKKALRLNEWPSKRIRGNVVIKFNISGGL